MIKTIIFDFGNVIGHFDHRLTLSRLLEHTDLSADEMRSAFYGDDLENLYEAGILTTPLFLERVLAIGRLRCSEEVLALAWADIFRPNVEVCALIPRLRPRYRLLLGSNTNDLHARQFLRQFADTLGHFDALVMSHQVGVRKPDVGFFRACQALAECAPEECLFIDDLPANVAGAKAMGWHGILYEDFDRLMAGLKSVGVALDGR